MSDDVIEPSQPHHPLLTGDGAERPLGAGSWRSRWQRSSPDQSEESGASPANPASPPPAENGSPARPLPELLETGDTHTHLHGNVDVLAGSINRLILEQRKRDVLEGTAYDRGQLLELPFIRDSQWDAPLEEAIDAYSSQLRHPVTIIVAPRSYGSTTFALRLLAEHTPKHLTLVKLEADWDAPSRGRLPLEKTHGFQLDLKDPTNDRPSTEFLDALSSHADHLRDCHSYLVLTVAQELWMDHRISSRAGVQVIHLRTAPDPQALVEAHLHANGYDQLAIVVQSDLKAQAALRGRNAVAAARAVRTIVTAAQEHSRQQQEPAPENSTTTVSLEARITAALTDWRNELDLLFGEAILRHSSDDPSLTVEDRCLLLALAVCQSAPMPEVARHADRLKKALEQVSVSPSEAVPDAGPRAFAGRGLRRRIHDVGARVDTQDQVLFDRPAYGRAVLEYVWDNYDIMREPLLAWLADTSDTGNPDDPAINALVSLTTRHGTISYLNTLGSTTYAHKPEVLSTVMERAVHDEHIGRLAWAALYRWAGQDEYAPAVISLCRRILDDADVAPSAAKMAIVRLRRVAHTTASDGTRSAVLATFDLLAQQSTGAARLVAEILSWQEDKTSPRSGSLAFLALMTVTHQGMPWLMTESAPDLDTQGAVKNLLRTPETTAEIIPRLIAWVRVCATDPDAYTRLRDRLLPSLRGNNMFEAGVALMQELNGISTDEGVNVADDFYRHLVDPRLQTVFPLKGDAA